MKRLLTLFLTVLYFNAIGQVTFDFENDDLSSWTQKPTGRWQTSTTSSISGIKSLKHTFDNTVAATDTIYRNLPSWNPSLGDITWRMKVKHGNDPSASNSWWIYLMTDGQVMASPGAGSGYAVGVNLTGSDDLLKIWRITDGTPQIILASTLNWQTQIGTGKAGAIEVERLADGTFTLKASINGNFTDLTNYGSSSDINHSAFNHFGILYRYTSSGDLKLWIDDINITFQPENLNNNTSTISTPLVQIPTGSISSLSINQSLATDIFRFAIEDKGSGDNLPTIIKRITFKNPTPTDSPWSALIEGVTLKGPYGIINIRETQITKEAITIDVDSTQLTLDDGEKFEFTLGVFLKSTNITDKTTLAFEIQQSHGFIASITGSGFEKILPSKVISSNFEIQVIATHLKFSQQPLNAFINKPFQTSVAGCDKQGNTDHDFTQPVTVSINEGIGNLTTVSGFTKPAVNGIALWNDIIYNKHETISLKAESPSVTSAISNEIEVLNDTTSTASIPSSQPSSTYVSSLLTSPEKAFEIMRIKLTDAGSGDNAPTVPKYIKLSRTSIPSIATLNKTIESLLVKQNGVLVTLSDIQIKTSTIEIYFGSESLIIPDGESSEISIWVYLKNKDLVDGESIQLFVDKTAHGFTTYEWGSGFVSKFTDNITSNIFSLRVDATKLSFKEIPQRVGVSELFSAKVAATDKNENIDKDFNGPMSLKLASGNGSLEIADGAEGTITNGEISYSNISYSIPEKFALLAQSSTLDDMASGFITCGDNDGIITPLQVNEDTLTINASNNTAKKAVELIKFRIKDQGSTDELPLIPTAITLNAFDPENVVKLAQMIKGFMLITETDTIFPVNFTINSNKLVINITENELKISNGDSIDVSICAYVRESSIIDNTVFRFYIPTINHGLLSGATGTAFNPTFPLIIYGNPCKIDIKASKLSFAQAPFLGKPNQPFTLKIATTDFYGNSDLDYQGQASLSLQSGLGQMETSPLNSTINGGIAAWNNVKVNSIGKYRFKATSDLLAEATSPEIFLGYNQTCYVNQSFEDEAPAWNGISNWKLSTISPIDGNQSLIHAGNPDSQLNTLTFPFNIESAYGKAVEWEVTIRNGNWDPSSDNYFYFIAACSSEDLTSNTTRGIAIGINPSTGNDLISLWLFEGTKRTNLIETPFDWNENDEVKLKLTLSPTGKLSLWYQPKQSGCMILGGEVNIPNGIIVNFGGLVYGYTASRAGFLWVDNLKICSVDYPPLLQTVKSMNLSSVRGLFSKNVNVVGASNASNYKIRKDSGEIIPINSATFNSEKQNEVVLTTAKMPLGNLTLSIANIADENGIAIPDSATFGIGTEGNIGRLVINEIMANPIPSVGLPEYEYVELYNPNVDSVSILGWKMQFNETTVTLPSAKIPPLGYATISTNTASTYLSVYGLAIGVTSFPSLLNDGMLIKLFDSNSNLIAFANYTKNWYNNTTRNSGGYSMECIDITNLAEGSSNWRASQASQGGTPCAPNSGAGLNPDITKPRVVATEVMDNRTIKITFSEPMDSLSLTLTDNYLAISGIGKPSNIESTGKLFDEATITLASEMFVGQIYTLTILNELMDFAGNRLDEVEIDIAIPQTPEIADIVINEVLFNPYTGGADFVEIFNNSAKTFDLKNLSISNRNQATLELTQTYSVSDTARLLFPNNYAVITTNPSLISQFYQIENPKAFIWTSNIPSFNSDKGFVTLLNEGMQVIDELYYTEKLHNALLKDTKGISLERINPNLPSSNNGTWQSASQVVGFATPTYRNSQFTEIGETISAFTLNPKTFSPDGDGKDDFLLIEYKLPDAGFVANIRVYSSNGVEVYRLANNLLLGTEGVFRWDGINFTNQRVPLGIYIIHIEYFNLKGEVKKEKKVCVVASRS